MKPWAQIQRFWLALRLTWQGKTVPRSIYGLHWDWLAEAKALLQELSAISPENTPLAARHFRYAGKEMALPTFIAWWEHCLERELPSLLRSGNAYALTAFQAQVWNLKDALLAWQATAAFADESLELALSSLIQHCQNLPQQGED